MHMTVKTSCPHFARSILAVHEDGAFQYAGHLNGGDRIRFGVGNRDAVLEGAVTLRNDVLAFPVEALLLQISRRLEKKIRSGQLRLYKMPADIFVILYQQVDLSEIRMMIAELDQILNQGYRIDGQEIHLSFTAGLCCSPLDP
jgi:hypothetical protein